MSLQNVCSIIKILAKTNGPEKLHFFFWENTTYYELNVIDIFRKENRK